VRLGSLSAANFVVKAASSVVSSVSVSCSIGFWSCFRSGFRHRNAAIRCHSVVRFPFASRRREKVSVWRPFLSLAGGVIKFPSLQVTTCADEIGCNHLYPYAFAR
jgi:hypothetical protein